MKHHRFENAAVMLRGVNAAREFLEPMFCCRDHELMIVAYCDDQLQLIKLLLFDGNKSSIPISLPDVFQESIGCSAIIVAHNHPSGETGPSDADLALSKKIVLVAEAIGVTLIDFLIFGGNRMLSFRKHGLL